VPRRADVTHEVVVVRAKRGGQAVRTRPATPRTGRRLRGGQVVQVAWGLRRLRDAPARASNWGRGWGRTKAGDR
jgi:hypothetical protein